MDNYIKKIYRFGNSRAVIIEGSANDKLDNVKKEKLSKLLKQHGVILFRRFKITLEDYSNLVASISERITRDPARKVININAQLIQAGIDAQGFHCENATLPFWPHLQWFYCNIAPSKGSQTTFCDGYEAWSCLRASTQRLFKTKKIKISRNIPEHLWKKYVEVELKIPYEKINFNHLKSISVIVPGQTYHLNSDNSVYSELLTYAVHKTLFSKKLAFANSILTPSYNYEKPIINFEDGTEIDIDVMEEIVDVTNKLTVEINWEPQDLVIIDNTSVMHGRRKIADSNREIYGAQSYLYEGCYNISQQLNNSVRV